MKNSFALLKTFYHVTYKMLTDKEKQQLVPQSNAANTTQNYQDVFSADKSGKSADDHIQKILREVDQGLNEQGLSNLSSARLSATGQRWVNELADFNFKIHYKQGRNYQDADALIQFPENTHQYTSRGEQSSINAIFKGVQTQTENEEAWFCAINTSKTAPEIDISPPQKNNLQQTDIYHDQNQNHWIKKVIDTQSKTKGTSVSQETSKEEEKTARQQQRNTNQEISKSGPNRHTTNLIYHELHEEMVS